MSVYAICETMDSNAARLMGPAVILNEEELAGIMMAVELMQMTRPYHISDMLLTVLAKLHYLKDREKPNEQVQ